MSQRLPQLGLIFCLSMVALSALWALFPALGTMPVPGLRQLASPRIALPLLLILAVSAPVVLVPRYARRESKLFVAGVWAGVGAILFVYIAMGLGGLLALLGAALFKQTREQ